MGTIAGGVIGGLTLKSLGDKAMNFGKQSFEAFENTSKSASKMQRYMGGSIEDASRLNHALQMKGLGVDDAARSLGIFSKMSSNAGQQLTEYEEKQAVAAQTGKAFKGSLGSAAVAMSQVGIALRGPTGEMRPMKEMLMDAAEQFKNMPEGADRTALAMKLFGRNGMAMLPFLKEGKKGINELMQESDKLGTTIGPKDQAAVKESVANKRRLGEAVKGLQITFGRTLLPMVEKVVRFMGDKLVPALKVVIDWIAKNVMPWVEKFANQLGTRLQPVIKSVGEWFEKNKDKIKDFGKNVFDLAKTIMEKVVPAVVAFGGWLIKYQGWLIPIAGGILAIVAALKLYQLYVTIVSTVTKIWTGIQAAFNIVMAANPIGLIVLAVVGLVVALVIAYKRSETFRNIVNGALYTTAGTGVHAWESESPPFCSGSMKLTPNASTLSGKAFKVPQTWNPANGGAAFGWFKTEQGASAFGNWIYTMWRTSGGTGSVSCYIDSSGQFVATITADGGTSVSVNSSSLSKDFNDDTWHFWLINVASGGKILSLYLDGAFITSATAANVLTIASTNRINIFGAYTSGTYALKGFQSTVGNATSSLAGTIAGVTAIALDMWNAGRWGDGGNTISARCTKVLEFLYPTGTPTITVSNVSAMNVAGQDTNNKAALAVLNEIADAERGVVYVDRLGDYKFRGSSARSAAYSLTIDALADLDGSNEFTLIADDSTFANRIVASGPAGSYTAEDATSIGLLGIVSETWSCVAWSLSTQVNARLADRLSTKARIGQVTVDLMTATSVSKSSVVQLVPLDCIRLTNLPSQLGATTRDAIVEGYTLNASVSSYQVTLDLSPTG